MVLYLNKFRVVVKRKEKYIFPELNSKEFSYEFSEIQEKFFREMMQGVGAEEEKISEIFSKEILHSWKKEAILLPIAINPQNQNSRMASYFWQLKMPDSIPKLKSKTVLILGAGGIGSHVAWNLTVMGIGTIYIVDFDTVECSNLNRQLMYDHEDIGQLIKFFGFSNLP